MTTQTHLIRPEIKPANDAVLTARLITNHGHGFNGAITEIIRVSSAKTGA